MSTKTAIRPVGHGHRARIAAAQQAHAVRRRWAIGALIGATTVAVIWAMLVTSRPTTSATRRQAPGFTLTDTSGREVSLADFRGRNVLLYFSEGAGCGSCLQQMTAIEQREADFDATDVTVLPIVMNTREQIVRDMATYGTRTPFLLDDGTVSGAYGTIGRGMHGGLPGHSFVLIDEDGVQRWYGEYPSMWLAPNDLLGHIRDHLNA